MTGSYKSLYRYIVLGNTISSLIIIPRHLRRRISDSSSGTLVTANMYNKKAIKCYEDGRLFHQQEKLSAAERAYRKAIKAEPNFVEAYNNLGNVLVDRGQLQQAFGAYQNALKIIPNHPMLLNNLGHVLQLQDEGEKAIRWFNKAIDQDPDYADAYVNLGNALRDRGSQKEALGAYQRAIKINPVLSEAFINLGFLLNKMNRFDDAIPVFESSIEIDPDNSMAYMGLGSAFLGAGEPSKAIEFYSRVLEIDPDYTQVYRRMASAFMELRQWDSAIAIYQQAIARHPGLGAAYMGLSNLKNCAQDKQMVEVMEQIYLDPKTKPEDLKFISFALGKAYADLADYDKSFACFEKGNQLGRDSQQYDVNPEIAYFEKLKSTFDTDEFMPIDGVDSNRINPIFIVGLPRSGKTLLETMLARHPQIAAAGEQDFLKDMLESVGDLNNPMTLVAQLKNLSGEEALKVAQEYLKKFDRFSAENKFIVDTMPINFYFVGFIKLLFPEAKVIHCYRQPMDACWFVYQKCFHNETYRFSYDLDTLAVYYRGYADLLDHWHKVFPGFIYDLEYEKLVTDTQREMSKLFSFLDLEWDGVTLEQYENDPLNDKGIGFWRHYEKHLGALLSVQS